MATPCNTFCECGNRASVLVSGTRYICARCHDIEQRNERARRLCGRKPVRGVFGEPVSIHLFHVCQPAHP